MTIGTSPAVQSLVDSFLKQFPQPTANDVTTFLKVVPLSMWNITVQGLISAGVPIEVVQAGASAASHAKTEFWKDGLTLASAVLSAFHGARRNNSVVWGAWWFLMGSTFPIFTPVIALAQGFGKRKS
jgi:hypothetical protein